MGAPYPILGRNSALTFALIACASALACSSNDGTEERDSGGQDASVCDGSDCAGEGGSVDPQGGSSGGMTTSGGRSGSDSEVVSGGMGEPADKAGSGSAGEGGAGTGEGEAGSGEGEAGASEGEAGTSAGEAGTGEGGACTSGSGGMAGSCAEPSCAPDDRDEDGVPDDDDNCPDAENTGGAVVW